MTTLITASCNIQENKTRERGKYSLLPLLKDLCFNKEKYTGLKSQNIHLKNYLKSGKLFSNIGFRNAQLST